MQAENVSGDDSDTESGDLEGIPILVKISHYNPSLGGINCYYFYNGVCYSNMANGESWVNWINKGVIACPSELAFESKILLDGIIYTCKDRGGAIVYDGSAYWIDILAESVPYSYGEVKSAILLK